MVYHLHLVYVHTSIIDVLQNSYAGFALVVEINLWYLICISIVREYQNDPDYKYAPLSMQPFQKR